MRNIKVDRSLQAAGKSTCGPRRTSNQDSIYHFVGQIGPSAKEFGLFVVCDGLGGLQAGDLASRSATSLIVSALKSGLSQVVNGNGYLEDAMARQLIKSAITDANAYIYRPAGDLNRMGTTVTLALIYDGIAHVANVGHGRIYLLRGNQIRQMTEDHSLAAVLASQGYISHSEIADHPHHNTLFRALGISDSVEVDQCEIELCPGDRLLLCTDGLWKAFPDQSELARLSGEGDLNVLIDMIVGEALFRDGSDNISAVLVSAEPDMTMAQNHSSRAVWPLVSSPTITPTQRPGGRTPG